MWPIKPHTENQIESPPLSLASSDDNNKSHDSITCVPSNTRPVQLDTCAVPYFLYYVQAKIMLEFIYFRLRLQ